MFSNPFRPKDPDFQKQLKLEEEVKRDLQELAIVANDLLNDTRYKKFNTIIDKAEKNTIDLLLCFKETDAYKYKARVDEFLIELRVYRNILASIKDLANPKPKEKVNFAQSFLDRIKNIN